MRYYQFNVENVDYFLELDKSDGGYYCLRAIFQKDNELYNTYLAVNHNEFNLPEGDLFHGLEHFKPHSEKEFQILWKKSMHDYENKWQALKQQFHRGNLVKTKILCFYPQGIISNFGAFFNALSDYEACKERFGEENMYPDKELELEIDEFDDNNKIVKLKIAE